MERRDNRKISRYPGSLNLNLGMIIFAVILIYVIICVVAYFRSRHIAGYEVKEGSLSSNHTYNTAIALRTEEIVPVEASGYINYFAAEGSRVGVGNLVYTIDEAGGMQDLLLSEGTDTITLSNADLSELRAQIIQFSSSFDPKQYNSVYNFKNSLQGTAQKLTNGRILENMQTLNDIRVQSIGYYNAAKSGLVMYYTDGFENLTPSALTADMFRTESYERALMQNNDLVETGDTAYKIITDENWCVVFQTDEETAAALAKEEYIKVRFLKNQYEAWGRVESVKSTDGTQLVALYFSNSMLSFANDRFLGIELLLQEQKGLKVPNSAIVEMPFYLIGTDYVTMGQEGREGVLKQVFSENGTAGTEFVPTQLYYEKNGYYYINTAQLEGGDLLYKPDSQETCTVGAQDSLVGVYNINKGFADFRQINVLYQNDEYAIVESNTMYGLSVYDRIVLDATTVNEDELVFE